MGQGIGIYPNGSFIVAISHHYFAGYGGGRKLIFPGLGEKESIYQNHKLFIDKKKSTSPGLVENYNRLNQN